MLTTKEKLQLESQENNDQHSIRCVTGQLPHNTKLLQGLDAMEVPVLLK